jgi:hypothetical protein
MSTPKSAAGKNKRRRASQRPPRQRARNLRAEYRRASQVQFVRSFSPAELPQLPLRLPAPTGLPPSLKRRFRSWYQPRSRSQCRRFLAHLKVRGSRSLDSFQLALYLLDFSPWRPLLLHCTTQASARGEAPFDPLSLLLACLWKVASGLPWSKIAANLAEEQNYARWRQLCGFRCGDTPSEATLRAFREKLPNGLLNYLQKLFLALLDQAGLLPAPEETHGYLLVGDGQRHRARSRHRCHHATTTCYQPTSTSQARPCPARQKSKGQYSCDCATDACRERCALTPRWDRQARYSVYDRQKEPVQAGSDPDPNQVPRRSFPDGLWGYRSLASRLVDTRFHVAWNAYSDCLPANADEGTRFPAHIAATYANLPRKQLGYVIYDAACGEQACLDAVYNLGGIGLFDITRHSSDQNAMRCQERGYDKHGHPLCQLGFPMTWLGLDRSRAQPRSRWACLHSCRQSAAGAVSDCPYRPNRKGQHRELKRAFDQDSYRLARLVPYGSKSWHRLTAWRNTSEGRNAALEKRGLKRFPDYGLGHVTFLVIGADIVENWCTLARLIYEAALLDERWRPLTAAPAQQQSLLRHHPTRSAAPEPIVPEPGNVD